MNILPIFAVPAALALAVASSACFAEEKAQTTTPAKAKATETSKTAKTATPQAPLQSNAVNSKAVTPAATRILPATERSQKSCHGDASDA